MAWFAPTHAPRVVGPLWCVLAAGALTCAAQAQDVADAPSLSLSAAYTADLRRNASGGMAIGTAYADSLDLGLAWSTDALFSGSRMTTNLAVMHLGGDGITDRFVGDLQGVNNIEATRGWKLYESWVEVRFGASDGSLRAGVLDLNAEFDTPVTQGLFVGAPFGLGTDLSQTGEHGPVVWPTTGLGVRAALALDDNLRFRFGAYDGVPGADEDSFASTRVSHEEGALLIGELEYASERIHKVAFGMWSYTAPFGRIDAALAPTAPAERGNLGVYSTLDLRLGSFGGVDFDGALRAGTASARFNAVDRYVGAALTAAHIWTARPDDSLGFGIAHAHIGAPYRALRSFEGLAASTAETLVELTYRAPLADWLSILPSVQFVHDPGADLAMKDAWVFGLRLEISRERSWQSRDSYVRTQPQTTHQAMP